MSSKKRNSAPIDRISNLHDELLCHILSFLTIEQAFATTVLSKRWALLCYSLSVFRFKFDDGETSLDDDGVAICSFCRFVDTLMLSPFAENQSIKTFSLKCFSRFYNLYRPQFDVWVEAAKLRQVKEFNFFLNNVTLLLNPTIFTSQTLVILKLGRLKVEAKTLYVYLPSLKTLHLTFVHFQSKNDFLKLLNACPILEDLHTFNTRYGENNEAEEFKSLFLSKLVRADIGSIDVPFNAISIVEFLCINYIQNATLKSIPVFRNLIHIELCLYQFSHGWDGVVELLRHCPRLQILYMRKWYKSLSKDRKCPILTLECVSSHLRSCTLLDFDGSENDLRFATYILENARLLEVMKINVRASSSKMQKHRILEKLSSCPRMSLGCKLSF